MNNYFSEEAQEILTKAKNEMLELKHQYIGTEHLVLAILHTENSLKEKLSSYNITYNNFKKELISLVGIGNKKSNFLTYTPLLKKVINETAINVKENNNKINELELFTTLLELGEGLALKIFLNMNIDIDNIYDEIIDEEYEQNSKNKNLLIESIGTNLTSLALNNNIDPVIGREKEITILEEILCRRNKNNPLLIGEPGIGKTAIVEELARRIASGTNTARLKNYKIISLDMASAVAGTKYRGEFEERIKKIIEEIEKEKNIILFIDEIHTLIGAGGAEGAIDASNILKPALARGKIKCIGATTNEEYKKHFEKDKALERRFQIIYINEPTEKETKNILYKIKPIYENYHKVKIKDEIIDKIIELTDKYIYDRYRPDKQIDILDEACSKASLKENNKISKNKQYLRKIIEKKKRFLKENNIEKAYEFQIKENKLKIINEKKIVKEVTLNDIAEVLNNKTKIPIYELVKDNKKTIENISKTLLRNIYGQDKAINELVNITKRIKLGYKENKCVSLLFIGPEAVGKTKLATLYGKSLSNNNLIKLNMSEYSDETSINKFLGSSPGYVGYDDNKYLLNIIKDNPTSTIIFDEIEKAHPKIINLISQILENGTIKDAKNNIISLKNNIIIMISNIGYKENSLGFNNDKEKNINDLKEIFNISFLNKIDNIIYFNKLNSDDIVKIINNKIENLKSKYKNIIINNNVINEILIESKYNEYGASRIEKIIKNKLENIIIDEKLNKKENIIINSILSNTVI